MNNDLQEPVGVLVDDAGLDLDGALLSELKRITLEPENDLLNSTLVGQHHLVVAVSNHFLQVLLVPDLGLHVLPLLVRNLIELGLDFDALGLGLHLLDLGNSLDCLAKVECLDLLSELPGLDLGVVEDILDQTDHHVGGGF